MKKERIKTAALFIGISLVVNVCFSALLSFVVMSPTRTYLQAFCSLFPACFVFFGGSSVISALLLLLTNMKDNQTFSYGAGFYYGTILATNFLNDFMEMDAALIISSVIAGLICYIFWLKRDKEESD